MLKTKQIWHYRHNSANVSNHTNLDQYLQELQDAGDTEISDSLKAQEETQASSVGGDLTLNITSVKQQNQSQKRKLEFFERK